MTEQLAHAIFQKVAFKGDEFKRYQATLLYTALGLWPQDVAADDVPGWLRPASLTTAGCAWALLKCDAVHVFERVGRRASRSEKRNAAWINTYRLTSRALANTWLERNGFAPVAVVEEQMALGVLA